MTKQEEKKALGSLKDESTRASRRRKESGKLQKPTHLRSTR